MVSTDPQALSSTLASLGCYSIRPSGPWTQPLTTICGDYLHPFFAQISSKRLAVLHELDKQLDVFIVKFK